jgi:hypothetical protein
LITEAGFVSLPEAAETGFLAVGRRGGAAGAGITISCNVPVHSFKVRPDESSLCAFSITLFFFTSNDDISD